MEKYTDLITILLQHSQRFLDFWNFQIIVSLAVLGFVFAEPMAMARRRVRFGITALFLLIAVFTVFSLSTHQRREEALYQVIETRASASDLTPADRAYLDSLKPTPFGIKAGAISFVDIVIVVAVWFGPKEKDGRSSQKA